MDATGDVVLRPPEISDAEPLHLLFRDPEVMRWIGDGRVRDLAYYEDFVHHQRELFRTKGYCFHTLCVEGRVAGFAGLHDWNAEWGPTGSVELGYRLGKRIRRGAQGALGHPAAAAHRDDRGREHPIRAPGAATRIRGRRVLSDPGWRRGPLPSSRGGYRVVRKFKPRIHPIRGSGRCWI